jgi:hypothetical protein
MADPGRSRRSQPLPKRGLSAGRCRVFAYGTLLEPGRQKKLFGRRVRPIAAILTGWSRVRCVGRYSGVVRRPGAVTQGGILCLTRPEIKVADRWEQVPHLYIRRRLSVGVKHRAGTLRCWTYVPAPGAARKPRPMAN